MAALADFIVNPSTSRQSSPVRVISKSPSGVKRSRIRKFPEDGELSRYSKKKKAEQSLSPFPPSQGEHGPKAVPY